jgi:hypothetical protein
MCHARHRRGCGYAPGRNPLSKDSRSHGKIDSRVIYPKRSREGSIELRSCTTDFGFNLDFNSFSANLYGKVSIIVRSGGRASQTKAVALSSPGVAGTTSGFSSKANIRNVTNPSSPISLESNATLQS